MKFLNLKLMEAKNTKYCKTCKGTQWHNSSLCFACEVTISQAKAIVLERARSGLSTAEEACAAIDEFESRPAPIAASKPACHTPYPGLEHDVAKELDRIQDRSLATQARALGVAV